MEIKIQDNQEDKNVDVPTIVKERSEDYGSKHPAIIDLDDIIGMTYLGEPEEDRTRSRLRIVQKVDDQKWR